MPYLSKMCAYEETINALKEDKNNGGKNNLKNGLQQGAASQSFIFNLITNKANIKKPVAPLHRKMVGNKRD
jgi:hypothetical protein